MARAECSRARCSRKAVGGWRTCAKHRQEAREWQRRRSAVRRAARAEGNGSNGHASEPAYTPATPSIRFHEADLLVLEVAGRLVPYEIRALA